MSSTFKNWTSDNYAFVGKAFDFAYADRLNKLSPVVGEVNAKSIDYELTGSGGYGEAPRYDGENLNEGSLKRGFKTVITPVEYTLSIPVGYKEAKVDKMGETKKVGTKLGDSMALTVYLHVLRMFANAWNTDGKHNGGDGVSWANAAHPVASRGSSGRTFVADTDAGTYSNISTDAFSVSAITAAQARANRFLTPDGMPFLCDFDTVLIAPELEEKAKKMFGENARLMPAADPESAYNAANPVYGMRYIVMGGGADGFTSKQWAVCDRRLMKELVNIVYNTRPTVMQSPQDNPLKDLYTAYADFGVGWGDARQIIFWKSFLIAGNRRGKPLRQRRCRCQLRPPLCRLRRHLSPLGRVCPCWGSQDSIPHTCLPPLIGEAAKPKALTEGFSYAEKDNPSVSLLADSSLYTREPL